MSDDLDNKRRQALLKKMQGKLRVKDVPITLGPVATDQSLLLRLPLDPVYPQRYLA